MEGDKMEIDPAAIKPCNNKIKESRKYDWTEAIQSHVKIAVVGDSGCGKTCLILAAKERIHPHPDEKFVSMLHPLNIEVDGKMEACMVAELDDDANRRSKIYPETDVVLLCFDQVKSTDDVDKWVRELKTHIPDVPVVWVHIKKEGSSSLPPELSKVEGFTELIECCPHTDEGVQDVFQEAIKKARGRECSFKK